MQVNGDRFCSSSEREPARVEQARVATIEAEQADGDPGRVAVEATIHRFFVHGVSARDARAYFDRTYHARHAARFTRIWARWQTDEQRQLRPRIIESRMFLFDASAVRDFIATDSCDEV
jgi:hypothetical protein